MNNNKIVCPVCGCSELRVIIHFEYHQVYTVNQNGNIGELIFKEVGDEQERYCECNQCYAKFEMKDHFKIDLNKPYKEE